MSNFSRILAEIDVAPLLAQIEAHPELWNAHEERRGMGSPHEGIPDIWVRYRRRDELNAREDFTGPHASVWYPELHKLPHVFDITSQICAVLEPKYLGGILITKIPAGKSVLPHHDRGTWHAEFYNKKVYVPLQSNDDCVNICEGEAETMRAGEVWTFDNLKVHSVENRGTTDRITLIVCGRVE